MLFSILWKLNCAKLPDNSTNFSYTSYDEYGNAITTKLTGAALYTYSPIKNQYGLVNAAGQLLVSETDGQNFEESDTLEEFLDKYGLLAPMDQAEIVEVKNPEYDDAYADYIKGYKEWEAKEPKIEDYTTTELVPSTIIPSSGSFSPTLTSRISPILTS